MPVSTIQPGQWQPIGHVSTSISGQQLDFTTRRSLNTHFEQQDNPISSYLALPGSWKLPLQVDLAVQLDSPALYLLAGRGHVTFGSAWQDNRHLGDLLGNDPKPRYFNNSLPWNREAALRVVFGLDCLAIWIDGELRYFSTREKYLRDKTRQLATTGISLGLACSKHTQASIRLCRITEFGPQEPIPALRALPPAGASPATGTAAASAPVLVPEYRLPGIRRDSRSSLDDCLAGLAAELRAVVLALDGQLTGSARLAVRRQIEGSPEACKVSYVSRHGFTWALFVGGNTLHHYFWWYMVSNHRYQDRFMGRKNDLTQATLAEVARDDPGLAGWLFQAYEDCTGCRAHCLARTTYEFAGQRTVSCHGRLTPGMSPQALGRLSAMLRALERVLAGQA